MARFGRDVLKRRARRDQRGEDRARRQRDDHVASITSAPQSRAEEQAGRQRRYLFSMSVRVVCFLGAILVGHGWLLYVLIAAALVLPYVAVVAANAVSAPEVGGIPEPPGLTHRELGPGSSR